MNLYTTNLTEKKRKMENPFTGEILYAPVDDPIDKRTCRNLREYLLNLGATNEENGTFIYIKIKDEGFLRLEAADFLSESPIGIALEFDSLSIALATILFNLCKLSKFAIRSGTDDMPVAVVKEFTNSKLEHRWKQLEEIESADSLLTWMKINFE